MSKLTSFPPEIDCTTSSLILGSMPGVQSLQQRRYYANPMNQFWRIIYAVFDAPLDQDYEKRLVFIKEKGLGLWDVLETCNRHGSLDSNIKNETVNDFADLFKSYPRIKRVLFNGTKAYESFRKHFGFASFVSIGFYKLPSTSPANTANFEQKLKEWAIVRDLLMK